MKSENLAYAQEEEAKEKEPPEKEVKEADKEKETPEITDGEKKPKK